MNHYYVQPNFYIPDHSAVIDDQSGIEIYHGSMRDCALYIVQACQTRAVAVELGLEFSIAA
jgi:hypothetical protein